MRRLLLIAVIGLPFFGPPTMLQAAETFDPAGSSLDDLVYHGSRYGNTVGKRALKKASRDELLSRGLPAFRYLVERVYMENMWFYIYARKMLKELPDEDAAKVLMDLVAPRRGASLTKEQVKRVRRVSVFLLGFCDTPQHSKALRPLLGDEDVCGAAARTLGKWKDRDSVPGIISLLDAEKESRRIKAAVALGEIGDSRAIKSLIGLLSDPVFTVRNSASESLAVLPGDAVGKGIVDIFPGLSGKTLRQAVRVIGEIRYEPAKPLLMDMLTKRDPWLCGDAVFSLRQLGVDLGEWSREEEKAMASHQYVKARLAAIVEARDHGSTSQ